MTDLLEDLQRLVGDDRVLGAGAFSHYTADRSGVTGTPDAVVLPGDVDQVVSIVRWAYRQHVPLVPRGGGTGYAGGCSPVQGGVVVAMERLRSIEQFDPLLWRIHVGAGVTTANVQRLARENGLLFPVDPGAAEESQIGGNVATNAGGPHCFKYGTTRHWVTGLRAVVPPGEIISLGGPQRKDVAGYDLLGLLVGSEGTLGIVTDVWLRLLPRPPGAFPVCALFEDANAGMEGIRAVLASGVVPSALEFLDAATMGRVASTVPEGFPASCGFLVIAEVDGDENELRALLDALGPSGFAPQPRELWRWRDGIGFAIKALRGQKISEDIAVPIDMLAKAIDGTLEIGRRFGVEACSWGHAGDGNVHSTFLFSPEDDRESARAHEAAEAVLELAVTLRGTISGEHGLGVLKNGHLRNQWNEAAVAAHRRIKQTFDPDNLMNPGKKLA